MTPRAVRRVVIVVFVLGIAGMIVFSIADNNGGALTAGLVTAVAALCLMVATAVGGASTSGDTEAAAADVEERLQEMVGRGADEQELRSLVQAAVDLGRARRDRPGARVHGGRTPDPG